MSRFDDERAYRAPVSPGPLFEQVASLPPDVSAGIREGMERADQNADARWKRETDAAIRQVALTHATFTADDVWIELDRNHLRFETHNKSALGPRLVEVAKTLRYMEKTPEVKRSTREGMNGNYLKVWRSLIYRDSFKGETTDVK